MKILMIYIYFQLFYKIVIIRQLEMTNNLFIKINYQKE